MYAKMNNFVSATPCLVILFSLFSTIFESVQVFQVYPHIGECQFQKCPTFERLSNY